MSDPDTLRIRIEQRVNRWLMRVMLYRFHRLYTLGWTAYTAPRWAWRALWATGMLRSGLAGGSVDRYWRPVPWFTHPCLEWLTRQDWSAAHVLEYGSGYGTAYWSAHAAEAVAVEGNPAWANRVRIMAPRAYVLMAGSPEGYIGAATMRAEWDVIIIDGSYRLDCAKAALPRLREGGLMIVDNSDVPGAGLEPAEYLTQAGLVRADYWGTASISPWGCTSLFVNA